ncbi:MAG: homoserine kinase [Thermaurantiacus sp.]
MAVYTEVPAETLASFLADYAVGEPVMAKGIAEGVSNSNYLVETAGDVGRQRFILTLYERRVDAESLPYVLALMEHLADAGLPVPRPVKDRAGDALRTLLGRPASLIAYLPGISVTSPTAGQCFAVGEALARLHCAARGFPGRRANPLGVRQWRRTLEALAGDLDGISPGLGSLAHSAFDVARQAFDRGLPAGTIHADLFPDNVLFLGDTVSGLIDFAFAADDLLAYDLAVAHAAWCFCPDGSVLDPARATALLSGYSSIRPLGDDELAALPHLCCAAALRFLLSRSEDWLAARTEAAGLVTHKDPRAFERRLQHYLAAVRG